MEECITHEEENGDLSKQETDESEIFSDDSESWVSDLDVLPPELHFIIAEHVVSNGTTSACMLTQVKDTKVQCLMIYFVHRTKVNRYWHSLMEEDYLWESVFEALLGGGEEKRQQMLQRKQIIEDVKQQNMVDAAKKAIPTPNRKNKQRPRKKKSLASVTLEAEKEKRETEKALQELQANTPIESKQEDPWSWKKEVFKAMAAQRLLMYNYSPLLILILLLILFFEELCKTK